MTKKSAQKMRMTLYKRANPVVRGKPTCIDLFSGAGGFVEGLRQAGWSIVSANDLDADAGATFRLNFPEASFFEGPISDLDPAELLRDAGIKRGELDCLVGGPPCQSFSYNNHQRSATNERAQLFRDYLRIVEALNPKTLLMENVPGMLTIDNGRILDEIKSALQELGYKCEIRIIYAEDFGVSQTRRRAFVAASRIGDPKALFPIGTHGPSIKPATNEYIHRWGFSKSTKPAPLVTVWDAIGDLPPLKSGGGDIVSIYGKETKTDFQRSVRARSKILHNHVCHDLSNIMLERIKHVPEGGNWTDIPRELLTAGMKRAELNCHTKRYGRLSKKGLASTLLTKCDPHWGAYIHPTQERTISVREAARLQGFPDKFRFAGESIGKHYTQIGNAVPVPVAKALGKAAKNHLRKNQKSAPKLKAVA